MSSWMRAEKAAVRKTWLPPKQEKDEAAGHRLRARCTYEGSKYDFCLGEPSNQAGFLPGPRQPQEKEARGGSWNAELEKGGS